MNQQNIHWFILCYLSSSNLTVQETTNIICNATVKIKSLFFQIICDFNKWAFLLKLW